MNKLVILGTLFLLSTVFACAKPTEAPDALQPVSPQIMDLNVAPAEVNSGSSARLNWQVTGATEINIDQGIGKVEATGEASVTPAATTVYTVTAINNAQKVTRSVTLTVTSSISPDSTSGQETKLPDTPVLHSPADGAVFYKFPRTTKLEWKRSTGAQPMSYVLQIQYDTREMPGQFSGYYADLTLDNTYYVFDFPAQTIGRWRVKAKNDFGESNYSPWRYFQYTR